MKRPFTGQNALTIAIPQPEDLEMNVNESESELSVSPSKSRRRQPQRKCNKLTVFAFSCVAVVGIVLWKPEYAKQWAEFATIWVQDNFDSKMRCMQHCLRRTGRNRSVETNLEAFSFCKEICELKSNVNSSFIEVDEPEFVEKQVEISKPISDPEVPSLNETIEDKDTEESNEKQIFEEIEIVPTISEPDPIPMPEPKTICELEQEDISKDLLKMMNRLKPKIWLRGDYGIQVESPAASNEALTIEARVSRWESQEPGELVSFTVSSAVEHEVKFNHSMAYPVLKSASKSSCLKYVKFGCSMVASNVKLETPSTVYIVVQPDGERTAPQRVFGDFPNGGFLFDNSAPVFKSRHGFLFPRESQHQDHSRRNLGAEEPFHLLKFRLGGRGVEVAIDDRTFQFVGSSHDALFSRNRFLSLGGTNAGCGEFHGGIGEVLVFPSALSDDQDAVATNYLLKRWVSGQEGVPIQLKDQQGQLAKGCVDYDDNDVNPLVWLPETNEASSKQFVDWTAHIRQGLKSISDSPDSQRKVMESKLKWDLHEVRRQIFGPPCFGAKPVPVVQEEQGAKRLRSSPTEPIPAKSDAQSQASNVRNSGVATTGTGGSGCKGVLREHSNAILTWKAPKSTPVEIKYKWEDEVEKVSGEIIKIQYGGKQLEEFLKEKARYLNTLRDKLFANICDDPKVVTLTTKQQNSSNSGSSETPSAPVVVDTSSKSAPSVFDKKQACEMSGDVLSWKAPSHAGKEDILAWQENVAKAKQELGSFTQGGAALDAFLKTMIRDLSKRRVDLFSKYCSNELV